MLVVLLLLLIVAISGDPVWITSLPKRYPLDPIISRISMGCGGMYGVYKFSNDYTATSVFMGNVHDNIVVNFDTSFTFEEYKNMKCNVSIEGAPNSCVGHLFVPIFSSIYDRTVHGLLQLKKFSKGGIILSGHFEGGSLAYLFAYSLMNAYDIKVNSVVTFGSPPVGNEHFINWVCERVDCIRYTDMHDPIPLMLSEPFNWGSVEALISNRMAVRRVDQERIVMNEEKLKRWKSEQEYLGYKKC